MVDGWAIENTGVLVGDLNLTGIRGIGDYAFFDSSGLTSVTIPDGVTTIGSWAFGGCSGLTSVTIPASVKMIRGGAFYDCRGLVAVHITDIAKWCGVSFGYDYVTAVRDSNPLRFAHNLYLNGSLVKDLTIPNGVTSIGAEAFEGCYGLTSVTIPNSVTNIGLSAFRGCSGLTSVTIPGSVKDIGGSVFEGCIGLESVTILDGVTTIGDSTFHYCNGLTSVTIPNSVTTIGSCAFDGCRGLTSVTIPDSVTSIWVGAFYGCSGLTSVTIPDSVTSIGSSAFSGCSGLTSVTIPGSVTSIGSSAFSGCSGLTSVTIPDGVTYIGYGAFYGCSGLTSVTIPDGVTNIGESAFSGCSGLTEITVDTANPAYKSVNGLLLSKDGKKLIRGLNGNVTIPYGVTSIGEGAFSGCSGLTSVTIPDGMTNIANYAFSGCSGLTSVTIPDGVTDIGYGAFYGCRGLTSVTIPDGVTNIANYAFSGCSGLLSMSVGSGNPVYKSVNGLLLSKDGKTLMQGVNGDVKIPDGVTSIGSSAFEDCSGLTSVTIPNSVTSIGYDAFRGCSGLTSVTIPDGVTSIGEWAFEDCSGLTSVTIPDGVTSIGYGAFEGCSGLTSVTIPNNVTSIGREAFAGCSSLTSVTIPDGVTSIGREAFAGCTSLTSVTIPASVTDISTPGISNESAFFGCSALKEIVVDAANPNYKSVNGLLLSKDGKTLIQGVNGDVTIPDGVARIGSGAFSGCGGLTRVSIPSSVTDIAELDEIYANWYAGGPVPAFYDCSGLMEIVVDAANPNYKSVNGLLLSKDGKTLLQGVNGDVTIPDGVTTIGRWAFRGCSGLTRVTIPSSVTDIAKVDVSEDMYYDYNDVYIKADPPRGSTPAFIGCSGLTEIAVDAANPVYKSVNGLLLSKNGKVLIQGVNGSVTIPDGVTRIREKAFEDCNGLTRVTLPDSLTYIEREAFSGCGGLTEIVVGEANPIYKSVNGLLLSKNGKVLIQSVNGDVTIPDGVTHIYEYAFSGYSGLTSVTIPDSVKIMESDTFAECSALTRIVFNGNAPLNDDWLYAHESYCLPDACCLYVRRDSTGWGVAIPGTWHGLRIEYIDEEQPAPVICKVTFDAQGGMVAESTRSVTNDCAVGELPEALWDGHTFDGWFTEVSGGSPVRACA